MLEYFLKKKKTRQQMRSRFFIEVDFKLQKLMELAIFDF